MTISPADVYRLSQGAWPGGVALSDAEADRVAAVLNHSATTRPGPAAPGHDARFHRAEPLEGAPIQDEPSAQEIVVATLSRGQVLAMMTRAGYPREEVQATAAVLPAQVDRVKDHAVLARFALTRGQLMDRMGASP